MQFLSVCFLVATLLAQGCAPLGPKNAAEENRKAAPAAAGKADGMRSAAGAAAGKADGAPSFDGTRATPSPTDRDEKALSSSSPDELPDELENMNFECGGPVFEESRAYTEFALLKQSLDAAEVGSLKDLISALPSDVLRHRALMYSSRSMQTASPEVPRVLLATSDGTLMLAFSAADMQHAELMVQGDDGKFSMYEVKPDPKGVALALSSENPPACLTCHGAEPRPIWDPYSIWKGAYGSVHGHMYRDSEELERYLALEARWTRGELPALALLAPEETMEARFYETPTRRFISEGIVRFSDAIAKANAARVAHLLVQSDAWRAKRDQLLGVLFGCQVSLASEALDAAAESAGQRQATYVTATSAAYPGSPASSADFVRQITFADARAAGALELVAKTALGLDATSWTTSGFVGEAATSMYSTPAGFSADLLEALAKIDLDVAMAKDQATLADTCATLVALSESAAKGTPDSRGQ